MQYQLGTLELITVGYWLAKYQYYDLEHVRAKLFQCFNKQIRDEAYYRIDVYIHVFLTTALGTDLPRISTLDIYLPV
jgi:hypothetical protein